MGHYKVQDHFKATENGCIIHAAKVRVPYQLVPESLRWKYGAEEDFDIVDMHTHGLTQIEHDELQLFIDADISQMLVVMKSAIDRVLREGQQIEAGDMVAGLLGHGAWMLAVSIKHWDGRNYVRLIFPGPDGEPAAQDLSNPASQPVYRRQYVGIGGYARGGEPDGDYITID